MRKDAQATACDYSGSPLKVLSKTTNNVTTGQAAPAQIRTSHLLNTNHKRNRYI